MAKAGDIFSAVRALVDDIEGDYATDELQAPLLQLAQEQLTNYLLTNPNVGKYKAVVVLPAVPSGTTSLASAKYFDPAAQLDGLDAIISMKEKPAGAPIEQYQNLDQQNDPPTVAQWDFNQFYSYTGDDIILPGASQALDLRIFGVFNPATIKDKDSYVLPGANSYLKLATAAYTARAHGNKELSTDYMGQARSEMFQILNSIVIELQTTPTRPVSFERGAY